MHPDTWWFYCIGNCVFRCCSAVVKLDFFYTSNGVFTTPTGMYVIIISVGRWTISYIIKLCKIPMYTSNPSPSRGPRMSPVNLFTKRFLVKKKKYYSFVLTRRMIFQYYYYNIIQITCIAWILNWIELNTYVLQNMKSIEFEAVQ